VKIHRSTGYVHIDLSGAEAAVLLDELENVRGGAKLQKIRQVCEELRAALALGPPDRDKKRGRPAKVRFRLVIDERGET
jgi:hypothetical protein